ncbi:PLASTID TRANSCRIPTIONALLY ACTIVE PROTEIN [Salix viminalis]|uniref:PLASTID TRANSCRIPTIONALLY ACTIVE PROTEIN n=1 Tax=Salix viminalis TaxID=40686 RepID=A0A9Q0SEC7_SALVM|nr:PLASTID TRANSCRIPTIONALLY ACTIVE PROTEIN [Salix viminalis]
MDNMSCIRRGVSVVAVPHGTSSRSSRKVCGFVVVSHGTSSRSSSRGCGGVRASMVDSYESSSDFVKRMEQAWLISEQPMPVACSSCDSDGEVECHWCRGTGFFILGDNILCQVPSRNTNCVICAGKGSMRCSDCKGTGFRAGWLGKPPISK